MKSYLIERERFYAVAGRFKWLLECIENVDTEYISVRITSKQADKINEVFPAAAIAA